MGKYKYVWNRDAIGVPVLLEVRDADGNLIARYDHDGVQYVQVHRSGDSAVIVTDELGSTRRIYTDGVLGSALTYDAFGNLLDGPFEHIGFGGGLVDPVTGLAHFMSRWYDPSTGRFTQIDGAEGDLSDPRSFNRYVFALNDPVNRIDPNGQSSLTVTEKLQVFAILAITASSTFLINSDAAIRAFLAALSTMNQSPA